MKIKQKWNTGFRETQRNFRRDGNSERKEHSLSWRSSEQHSQRVQSSWCLSFRLCAYLSHVHFGTVMQGPREALPLLHHQVIGHRLQPSETNTIVHVLHVLRVLTLSEFSHSSPSTTFQISKFRKLQHLPTTRAFTLCKSKY